jgi:hypothetical protein
MDSRFEAWMVGIIAIPLAGSRWLYMERLRVIPRNGYVST